MYVSFGIVDDDVAEEDEYVILRLVGAENGVIGYLSETRVNIGNDDGEYFASFFLFLFLSNPILFTTVRLVYTAFTNSCIP